MNKQNISQILNLMKKQQFNLAEKNINEKIKHYPDDRTYLNLLAIVYASQKKFISSIKVLENFINIQSKAGIHMHNKQEKF